MSKRLYAFLLGVLVIAAAGLSGCQSEDQTLTLWTAWEEAELEVLRTAVADYEKQKDVAVNLVTYQSREALLDALLAADRGPDLFLGQDSWSERLSGAGIVSAYCLPGGCPECREPNPPRWCRYATGQDFSYLRNPDFALSTALCLPGGCPQCSRPNPPKWCLVATRDLDASVDIFQVPFLDLRNEGMFPYGIPVWWSYVTVLANPQWFVDQGQTLPLTMQGVQELAEAAPSSFYFDPAVSSAQIPWKADPTPTPAKTWKELFAAGDPSPQPSVAGVIITEARHFPRLQKEIDQLVVLPLSQLMPRPAVEGVFVSAKTDQREAALDLAYQIATKDTQERLFQAGDRLPAHGGAWSAVADESLLRFGLDSFPAFLGLYKPSLEGIDPRDFIQVPELDPPAGTHPVCGPAAQLVFSRVAQGGPANAVRAFAGFDSWEDFCIRSLEHCGPENPTRFATCLATVTGRAGLVDYCCARN